MARFVPVMIVGLAALGLLIGGVTPGLVDHRPRSGSDLFFAIWLGTSASFAERPIRLAPYAAGRRPRPRRAFGLLIADVSRRVRGSRDSSRSGSRSSSFMSLALAGYGSARDPAARPDG